MLSACSLDLFEQVDRLPHYADERVSHFCGAVSDIVRLPRHFSTISPEELRSSKPWAAMSCVTGKVMKLLC